MKNSKFKLEIVVSVILFFLIVSKVQLITFINTSSVFQSLLIIIFFFLAFLGIVGMFLQRHWGGYAATYFLILVSSIALGIAPIPFITSLFSINASTFLIILTSVILFLFTVYLHLSFSKSVNKKIN